MSKSNPEVLLVEANTADAEAMMDLLMAAVPSAHVECVSSGEAALDYLFGTGAYADRYATWSPDLIFLNLNLRGVTGLEILQVIKSYIRTHIIPTVILLERLDLKTIGEAYSRGANSCLLKAIGTDEFKVALQHACSYWLTVNRLQLEDAETTQESGSGTMEGSDQ